MTYFRLTTTASDGLILVGLGCGVRNQVISSDRFYSRQERVRGYNGRLLLRADR